MSNENGADVSAESLRQPGQLSPELKSSMPPSSGLRRRLSLITRPLRNRTRNSLKILTPRSLVRQTITGDRTKRVRDHVRETTAKQTQRVRQKLQEPPVIRFMDKTGFLLGVLGLVFTEWVFARLPEYFWLWYCLTIPTLVSLRYYMYKQLKYQYFLIDFCYFAQMTTLVNIFFFPRWEAFWKINFILSHGPLLWAIPAWRNSFVFHCLDKVTSLFIHGIPPLLLYTVRWHTYSENGKLRSTVCENPDQCSLLFPSDLLKALGFYLVWQILYILKTEVMDREKIQHDPCLATSIRWLSSDSKNAMNVVVLFICRSLGIFAKNETFNAETWKTKIVFWVTQFVYTIFTMLPAFFMFSNIYVNGAFIWYAFLVSIWNGANYYIEVFAEKYVLKFGHQPGALQSAHPQQPESTPSSSAPLLADGSSPWSNVSSSCETPGTRSTASAPVSSSVGADMMEILRTSVTTNGQANTAVLAGESPCVDAVTAPGMLTEERSYTTCDETVSAPLTPHRNSPCGVYPTNKWHSD